MALRGAYDIGSGATKLQVAEIVDGRIKESHFALEIIVNFSHDSKQQPDGCLSDAIQEKGMAALEQLHAEAAKLGVCQFAAVCTEVFRRAPNGASYREKVEKLLGTKARLLDQSEEALIGYKTAQAFSTGPASDLVSWDSGGGSFQICCLKSDSKAASSPSDLDMYLGSLGSGVCTAMFQEKISSRGVGVSPNPVTVEQANSFVELLLDPAQRHLSETPPWLANRERALAIGGPTSIFRLCLDALGIEGPDFPVFGMSDVEKALDLTLNKTDDELSWHAEPEMVVPKLCLLLAVMRKCGFKEVKHSSATGSCPGVLVSDGWYESVGEEKLPETKRVKN